MSRLGSLLLIGLILGTASDALAECAQLPYVGTSSTSTATAYDALPRGFKEKFDWVRMKSGEWLKGELLSLRRNDVVFDSDELNELNLTMDDISEIYIPRPAIFAFEEGEFHGKGMITKTSVAISTPSGVVCRPRSHLLSIIEDADSELDYWSLKAKLGVDAHFGNTEQASASAGADVYREGTITRLWLSYEGSYGRANDVENVHKHRGESSFDVFLTTWLALRAAQISATFDRFQNIGLRLVPGAGLVADVVDHKTVELDIGLSGAYQYTRFLTVSTGDREDHNAGVQPNWYLDWDITKDLEFQLRQEAFIAVVDPGQSTIRTKGDLSLEITSIFDFDITAIHNFLAEPRPAGDGTTPKQHDMQLIVGVGIELD